MSPLDARNHGPQPQNAEKDEFHSSRNQGTSRSDKPDPASNVAFAEGRRNMSPNKSNTQDQNVLPKAIQEGSPSHNQRGEARRNKSQTVQKASVANASAADTDDCDDEQIPPQLQGSRQMASEQMYTRFSADESPGFGVKVKQSVQKFFYGKSELSNTDQERYKSSKQAQKSRHVARPPEHSQANGATGQHISRGETAQVANLTQRFNQEMREREAEWQSREREFREQIEHMQIQNQNLEHEIQQIQGEVERSTHILQAKVQEAESEKDEIKAEYQLFLRQTQEEKFKEMDSWLAVEGSKVIGELDRLKRDMRAFGKGMSTNYLAVFPRLEEADQAALLESLAKVCVLTNGALPKELAFSKSSALLLNALLAHHVYTTLFTNPFFFLGNGLREIVPQSGLDSMLNELYIRIQHTNHEEVHIWRSQTLRLLLPQLRGDATIQEKALHSWTSELISEVANLQAAHFLEGPARHLIKDEAKANVGGKLQKIYETAANISYQLWTRRSTLKCSTLKDLGRHRFDPESNALIPHTSVKFEQFEDKLENRPITLVIHPLLQLYGTNEAKDYHQGSVWAPAEVWLDSRLPTQ